MSQSDLFPKLPRHVETPFETRQRRVALLTAGVLLLLGGVIYGLTSGSLTGLFRMGSDTTVDGTNAPDGAGKQSGSEADTSQERKEYEAFVAQLHETDRQQRWRTGSEEHRAGGRGGNGYGGTSGEWRPDTAALFAFDPNTADSVTLRRLGLPAWMAQNLLKYRQAGGHFRRAEQLRRLYGMTDEGYRALAPYIRIDTMAVLAAVAPTDRGLLGNAEGQEKDTTAHRSPSATYGRLEKYAPGTVVDLNRADTTELQRIPGVGSAIAAAIVAYRERLGGYHHIGQLREINFSQGRRLDTAMLAPWLTIDTTALQRLNLNRAGIERLRRHPYLNFYQARAIAEARRRDGALTNLRILSLLDEFTTDDLTRLAPYVCFSETQEQGK